VEIREHVVLAAWEKPGLEGMELPPFEDGEI